MPQRCGQIGRANEDTIDPVDAADRLQLLERRSALDLHEHADLFISLLEIVLDATEITGAAAGRHPTHAPGWITDGRYRPAGFLCRLHVGQDDRLRTDVEYALDQHRIIPGRPNHGTRRASTHCL